MQKIYEIFKILKIQTRVIRYVCNSTTQRHLMQTRNSHSVGISPFLFACSSNLPSFCLDKQLADTFEIHLTSRSSISDQGDLADSPSLLFFFFLERNMIMTGIPLPYFRK